MACNEFNALSMLRWRWMQKKEVCVHRSTLVAATVQRKIKTKQTLFIILANIFALYVSPFLLMPLTEVKVLKSASQCFRFKSLVHSICCDTRKSWTRSCVSFSKWNHSLFAWTWFSCFGEKKQTFKRFSVPAALILIFAHAVPVLMRFFAFVGVGFFLNQVKAFIAKRLMCSVCVHCTCIAATSTHHAKPSKYYVFLKASSSTIFFDQFIHAPSTHLSLSMCSRLSLFFRLNLLTSGQQTYTKRCTK